jgi:hypothetical protein
MEKFERARPKQERAVPEGHGLFLNFLRHQPPATRDGREFRASRLRQIYGFRIRAVEKSLRAYFTKPVC